MSSAPDERGNAGSTEAAGNGESRGVKRTSEGSDIHVHTANDWEHAHLEGGDERKQKFLRLMGAGKREHHGKVTIGESEDTKQHGRTDKEEEELESSLEKQFEANLEYKLKGGARQHKGLGFHDEDKSKQEKESQGDAKDSETKEDDKSKTEEPEAENKGEESEKEKGDDASKHKDSSPEEKSPDSGKKYAMSFVKASS